MGNLIYSMSISLDSYIETSDEKLDWVIVDEEFHTFANEETRKMDVFLYGRRMYELMSAYWPTADDDPSAPAYVVEFAQIWREKPKIVFSRTLDTVEWNSRLVRDNIGEEIKKLKAQYSENMSVGGAKLASTCVRLDLIDDYRLYVQPVILGGGTPYLPELERKVDLRLVETKRFRSGVVFLRYLRVGDKE